MILVEASVLPEVYHKVIEVKRLLSSGNEKSAALACSKVGISRSAYYKYRDSIFEYSDKSGTIVTLGATLNDVAGILSHFMSVLYESGANILTVNQNIPTGGKANVSVAFRTDNLKNSTEEIISKLKLVEGVECVNIMSA